MYQDDDQGMDDVNRASKRADRLFNEMMPTLRWLTVRQQKMWRPPTDVFETDESVIVKVEIAGMSEKDSQRPGLQGLIPAARDSLWSFPHRGIPISQHRSG